MSRARICLIVVAVTALLLASGAPASGGSSETPIVVHVEQGGFRWSDAAIGVVAGAGIALVAVGSVVLLRLHGAGAIDSREEER